MGITVESGRKGNWGQSEVVGKRYAPSPGRTADILDRDAAGISVCRQSRLVMHNTKTIAQRKGQALENKTNVPSIFSCLPTQGEEEKTTDKIINEYISRAGWVAGDKVGCGVKSLARYAVELSQKPSPSNEGRMFTDGATLSLAELRTVGVFKELDIEVLEEAHKIFRNIYCYLGDDPHTRNAAMAIFDCTLPTTAQHIQNMPGSPNDREVPSANKRHRVLENQRLSVCQRNAEQVVSMYKDARRHAASGIDIAKNHALCQEALKYLMVRACGADQFVHDTHGDIYYISDCYAKRALLGLMEEDLNNPPIIQDNKKWYAIKEIRRKKARNLTNDIAYQAKLALGYNLRPVGKGDGVSELEHLSRVLGDWYEMRRTCHIAEVKTAVKKLNANIDAHKTSSQDVSILNMQKECDAVAGLFARYPETTVSDDALSNFESTRHASAQFVGRILPPADVGKEIRGYYEILAVESGLAYVNNSKYYYNTNLRDEGIYCLPSIDMVYSPGYGKGSLLSGMFVNPHYEFLMAEALLLGEGVMETCVREQYQIVFNKSELRGKILGLVLPLPFAPFTGGTHKEFPTIADKAWLNAFEERNTDGLAPPAAYSSVYRPLRDSAARILLQDASRDRDIAGGFVLKAPEEAKILSAAIDLGVGGGDPLWGDVGQLTEGERRDKILSAATDLRVGEGDPLWSNAGKTTGNKYLRMGLRSKESRKRIKEDILRALRNLYRGCNRDDPDNTFAIVAENEKRRGQCLKVLTEAAYSGNVTAMRHVIKISLAGSNEVNLNVKRDLASAVELINAAMDQGMMYNKDFRNFIHDLAKREGKLFCFTSRFSAWNAIDGIIGRVRLFRGTKTGRLIDFGSMLSCAGERLRFMRCLFLSYRDSRLQAADNRALRAIYCIDKHGRANLRSYLAYERACALAKGEAWNRGTITAKTTEFNNNKQVKLKLESDYRKAWDDLSLGQERIRREYAFFEEGNPVVDDIADTIDSRIRTRFGERRPGVSDEKYDLYVRLGKYLLPDWNQLSSGNEEWKLKKDAIGILKSIDMGETIPGQTVLELKGKKWGSMFKSLNPAHKEYVLSNAPKKLQGNIEHIVVKYQKLKKFCVPDLMDWNNVLRELKEQSAAPSLVRTYYAEVPQYSKVLAGVIRSDKKGNSKVVSNQNQALCIEYHPEGCPPDYRELVKEIPLPLSVVAKLDVKIKGGGTILPSKYGSFVAYFRDEAPKGLEAAFGKKPTNKATNKATPAASEDFMLREQQVAIDQASPTDVKEYFERLTLAMVSSDKPELDPTHAVLYTQYIAENPDYIVKMQADTIVKVGGCLANYVDSLVLSGSSMPSFTTYSVGGIALDKGVSDEIKKLMCHRDTVEASLKGNRVAFTKNIRVCSDQVLAMQEAYKDVCKAPDVNNIDGDPLSASFEEALNNMYAPRDGAHVKLDLMNTDSYD